MKRAGLVVVAAFLFALSIVFAMISNGGLRTRSEAVVMPSPAVHTSATSTPTVSEMPSVSPKPEGSATTATIEPTVVEVPMATARSIALDVIGYYASVGYLEMGVDGGRADPPDYVSSWGTSGYGSLPGTDAPNTVYMYCHTARAIDFGTFDHSVADQLAPCRLFQRAYEADGLIGQVIVITTDAGQVSYLIDQVLYDLPREEYVNHEIRQGMSGRLVVTMCMYDDQGPYTDHKFVVLADLL